MEHGLTALVHFDGNAGKARDWLADKGIKIPADTLRYWKNSSHVRRYHELAELHAKDSDDRAAQRFKELSAEARDTISLAIEEAQKQLRTGEAKNPGQIAMHMSQVAGIAIDKARIIEDKPTVITHNKSAEELYAAMVRMGQAIEGTAEEVQDAQIEAKNGQ